MIKPVGKPGLSIVQPKHKKDTYVDMGSDKSRWKLPPINMDPDVSEGPGLDHFPLLTGTPKVRVPVVHWWEGLPGCCAWQNLT